MKQSIKGISENIVALAATALISSGATYWFCASNYETQLQEAHDKIAALQETERNALVTKRISEQMEDIAFEQKTLSDRQRARAEEQSRIADIERGKAEMERSLAQKAEREALFSARQADSMRLVAETESERAMVHALQAHQARAQADTLYYISLARSLAQNSTVQLNSGNRELAALLSYSGWYFNDIYGGNPYKQDIFTALLKTAPDAQSNVCHLTGNVRSLLLFGGPIAADEDLENDISWKHGMDAPKAVRPFIAVTDYGEVVRVNINDSDNGNDYDFTPLFSDNSHIFRAACLMRDRLYLLDTRGCIMSLDAYGNRTDNSKVGQQTKPIILNETAQKKSKIKNSGFSPLSPDTWMHLKDLRDGMLVAAGRRQVAWIDPANGNIVKAYQTNNDITTLGVSDDLLFIFCHNGEVLAFDGQRQPVNNMLQIPKSYDVTSYYFQKDNNCHYLGTENGDIYVCDRTGKYLATLIGHSGRITSIDQYASQLVTSSYDKNICIWDIADFTALMTPIKIGFNQWPLCFAYDKPARTLRVGLANGDIETVRISISNNTESTHRSITREFTPQEWNYYIGANVPFVNFKQQ